MDPAFELASVRNLLRSGLEKGYWTIDQLDRPGAHFTANTHVDRKTFPRGYTGVTFRNLLRDEQIPPHPEAHPHSRDFDF